MKLRLEVLEDRNAPSDLTGQEPTPYPNYGTTPVIVVQPGITIPDTNTPPPPVVIVPLPDPAPPPVVPPVVDPANVTP